MRVLQLTKVVFNAREPHFYLSEDSVSFHNEKRDKSKVLVPSFLSDKESVESFQEEVNHYYNLVLPQLVKFLNLVHHETRNILFWERIICFWLQTYISNYLDKLRRLERATEIEQGLVAYSLAFDDFEVPISSKDFLEKIRVSDAIHLQQYSVVLRDHYPKNVEFVSRENSNLTQSKADRKSGVYKSLKDGLIRGLLSLIDLGYRSDVSIYIGLFSNKDLLKFFVKSGFKIAPIVNANTVAINAHADFNKRDLIKSFSTGDDLADNILISSVKYFLPLGLLEGYNQITSRVLKHVKKRIPRSIFTGVGFYWSTEFAVWASLCAEKGSTLYGMQHGGTYGECEILAGELLERKISDYYITWGWKEDDKTIPLPAPRLMKKYKGQKVKGKQEGILWITTADSRYNYFTGNIVFGNRFLKYFEHQKQLYLKLNTDVRNKITIRLYPNDFGWNLAERWVSVDSRVKFSHESSNFIIDARKHKLVLIDHLGGTTFLQLLDLGIPVIVVAEPSLFEFRETAQKLYADLENVGVLFRSIDSASKAVSTILLDVDGWMNNTRRKNVIEKFKMNFAFMNKEPSSTWIHFLRDS